MTFYVHKLLAKSDKTTYRYRIKTLNDTDLNQTFNVETNVKSRLLFN